MQPRKASIGMASIRSTSTISLSTDVVMKTTGLEPCAASASLVVYAQGTSILCLRHETLELERRFERHVEEVLLISIDNATPDAPRVVSIDAGKCAIVWDLLSGEEFSRFTSYEDIRVAAWMKNGNLAFGDSMGNVILFDPIRSESISARTIFDPLTSIAPSSDCRSFALGYNNGSILVAALSPSFTILHTLTTTSLQPSPIATLAWHASSSKQKSDMLAVQTRDGDLRVWSVPKSIDTEDTARVVRVLKRPDGNNRGDNWLSWSRNGRIVQYSAGSTTVWDVRTKKVAWEEIPLIERFGINGICAYGPAGTLFTLSEDHSVQQFTLQPQALVANVLHPPTVPPPSPPVSIEEKKEELGLLDNDTLHSEVEDNTSQDEMRIERRMTPLGRIAQELEKLEQMEQKQMEQKQMEQKQMEQKQMEQKQMEQQQQPDGGLGISNIPKQRSGSVSSTASAGSTGSRHKHNLSTSSKGTASSANDSEYSAATTVSPTSGRKGSVGAAPQPSPRKLHPLRQEIHVSPEVAKAQSVASSVEVKEIFINIKECINSVTYESPRLGGPRSGMDEDDHRKEMLFCLFGWKGDIEGLISDELESVNARSLNALILRMWLGDLDQNSLAVLLGADFTVSGDWLFIALSAMGGQNSWTHVARAFVMKLLQKNDLHMAVLCLLAIGDKNDAVELYVSHKRYLEAVLLTCLTWKKDWKRISQLVRKWGEYALETHDTGLAARCFACAGTEAPPERAPLPSRSPSNFTRSPSNAHARSASHMRSRSENESMNNFVRGLSISSPSNPRTTLKMTPKNSPLKLITDFPSPEPEREPVHRSATTSPQISGVNRFFYPTGGRSACATPIAMSALTPVDPFWQNDPFPPSNNRSHTPGQNQKLPPVTESSPADATAPPTNLRAVGEKELKISSPIEPRSSSGFGEAMPTSFGEASRGGTPANVQFAPSRKPSPPTGRRSRRPSMNDLRRPSLASMAQDIRRPNTDGHGYRRPSMPTGSDIPPPLSPPPTEALPTPPQSAFAREIQRSHTPRMAPAGLQIQWPAMDGVLREGTPSNASSPPSGPPGSHTRKGSLSASPPVPSGKFAPRRDPDSVDDFMDLVQKGHKRLDSQRAVATPRGTPRPRQQSPEPRGRANRPRDLSLSRGRTENFKGSHMRSPSSPLPYSPQARLYTEDVPQPVVEDEPEPLTGRFYGDERGREPTREPEYQRSPSSPPAYGVVEQAHHYHQDASDRVEGADEYDDERYYTTLRRVASKTRDHSRGRARDTRGGSHMRSPSSPLPMSPQAQLYAQMAAEDDREQVRPRPTRRPSLQPRLRERPPPSRAMGSLRRSRSEKTLKQWSQHLEREGRRETSLDRGMSTRGLPSNPRIWRAELQAASRSNSPAPVRGRSPSGVNMAPAPPRSFTPAGTRSPRNMSPRSRALSPGMRTDGYRSRSSSRQPMVEHHTLGEHMGSPRPSEPSPRYHPEPSPRNIALPTSPPASEVNSYYNSPKAPQMAEYESIGSPLQTRPPDLPTIPGMLSRSPSQHRRNQSAPTAYAPLIRKLGRQDPPDSPPPLPFDLPVHPALQMHLDPSLPGRKTNAGGMPRSRTIRRVQRSVGGGEEYAETNEASIVVGIEAGEAIVARNQMQWHNPNYGERERHHRSTSTAGSSGVGSGNMI